ncbi:MAG: hypothetical protein NT056_00670 [Proteobacteria bacterium]|nr:hypothetical protein [Pseudomonadota bacterium]
MTRLKTADISLRKNWFFLPLFFLFLGLFFPLFSCSAHSDSGRTLTIVYANRINGQLDPCG